ncbi:hypothetical protein TRFO_27590 [Tritrichomonas foetus]|uniref:Protein kinase domain-containing protein n=1 Tax=Tritrichomonas foetus TaxID=1144522 RepID=A0A1J4K5A6_9EUKA|nr:hypothetical protein TRFO_27590 [Tritrichomonas foetus]|eukprot:OHT04862.1 hypothetical protein TRFO_27590 [Tritrichomonas foetus]
MTLFWSNSTFCILYYFKSLCISMNKSKFQIHLLGYFSGKSSLLNFYINNVFLGSDKLSPDEYVKKLIFHNQSFDFILHKIPPQDCFKLINHFITNEIEKNGIVITYSVDSRESFDFAKSCFNKIQRENINLCSILVSTKFDIEPEKMEVKKHEGEEFAHKYGIPFIEISTKDNVKEAFELISSLMIEKFHSQLNKETQKGDETKRKRKFNAFKHSLSNETSIGIPNELENDTNFGIKRKKDDDDENPISFPFLHHNYFQMENKLKQKEDELQFKENELKLIVKKLQAKENELLEKERENLEMKFQFHQVEENMKNEMKRLKNKNSVLKQENFNLQKKLEKLNRNLNLERKGNEAVRYIDDSVIDNFLRVEKIGEGTTSQVVKVERKEKFEFYRRKNYAMKIFKKDEFKTQRNFICEHEILSSINHPCILKIYGYNYGTNQQYNSNNNGNLNKDESINQNDLSPNSNNNHLLDVNPNNIDNRNKNDFINTNSKQNNVHIEEKKKKKHYPFLLLSYQETSLEKEIQNLNETEKAMVIIEIVIGLRYIQEKKKIIHRDLKPSNILMNSEHHIRISDFGGSASFEQSINSLSSGGFGTLRFVAPEVLNNLPYSQKIDQYSFGIILYFIMNNGELPPFVLGDTVRGEMFPIPKEFPEFCKEIIMKCCSFDPDDRPTFSEILCIIEQNNYSFFPHVDVELVRARQFYILHKEQNETNQ